MLTTVITGDVRASDAAAIIFCVLMAGLSVFQLALASGAPWGRFAWGGSHDRLPTGLRFGSIFSIGIYGLFSAIVVERAGLMRMFPDPSVATIGIWVVTCYLALGIGMNAISRSRPERYTMTPVAILLCALAIIVLLAPAE